MATNTFLLPLLFLLTPPALIGGSSSNFDSLIDRMDKEILEFRNEIENSYNNRCSGTTISSCYLNNYDDCLSAYPQQYCPSAAESDVVTSECGKGVKCNSLYDNSISTVRIPGGLATGPDSNPTDSEIIETVCFTRIAEAYMKRNREEDEILWRSNGVAPPPMYYGDQDGTFRIYPARHSKVCGSYDPRTRPWYLKAVPRYISESSGNKDVIIMLDLSRSMGRTGHLDRAKQATTNIIDTLSEGDRVAVIAFSEDAEVVGASDELIPASVENKEALKTAVKSLVPIARSNFIAAFNEASRIWWGSSPGGNNHCGIRYAVMLFLTDGEMNAPQGATEEDLFDVIRNATEYVDGGKRAYVFTYTFGDDSGDLPKKMACQTGGLWKRIKDDDNLKTSMTNYHKFFATVLGHDANKNLTSWAGPYKFANSGVDGMSISALAFDRIVDPPQFLGAVGMDINLAGLENALRNSTGVSLDDILANLTRTPEAACVNLTLGTCQLESLRVLGGGEEARCNITCDVNKLLPEICLGEDEYPRRLWENTRNGNKSYEERVCCEVGSTMVSDQCPALDEEDSGGLSNAAKFGIILGSLLLVEVVGCYFFYFRKKK